MNTYRQRIDTLLAGNNITPCERGDLERMLINFEQVETKKWVGDWLVWYEKNAARGKTFPTTSQP